ncbi:MAG: hypothetical protein K2O89_04855 [Clostridia bacterium]|nr:hypothetical protein [Clostridia bacterium]
MFKVIFKTALKTLLVVALVVLVAFGIASLGFPSEMAGLCEKSGNYSLATGYASLSYTYTGNVNDLNRCFLDSVYAKNDSDIVKFGDKLISDEKFEEVCNLMNGQPSKVEGVTIDYKQYVHGSVAAAKYRSGNKEEALKTAIAAMDGVEGFPINNALAILSLQVISDGDTDTANSLLAEIENHGEAGNEYYETLIKELRNVGGQV